MSRPSIKAVREWSVGIVSLPAYVNEDPDAPFKPDLLVWIDENGNIVGSEMGAPGETLAHTVSSLNTFCRQPLAGKPRKPTHVRSTSTVLLDALRPHFPEITFTQGPTPALDDAVKAMQEHFANLDTEEGESGWLGGDLDAETVARFHRAAADLYRRKPWDTVPSDIDLFVANIPAVSLHEAVVTVIGQAGQSYGIVVFPGGIGAFDEYMRIARNFSPGGPRSRVPFHFSLNFERGAHLPTQIRKEVAEHQWEVANANAYPDVTVIDPELVGRAPTRKELLTLEILAHALVHTLGEKPAELLKAWSYSTPVTRSLSVQIGVETFSVTMHTATEVDVHRGDDFRIEHLLLDLYEHWFAEIEDGEDGEMRRALMADFLHAFEISEEAAGCLPLRWTPLFMELAFYEKALPLTELNSAVLRRLLFETIPRKVMTPPQMVPALIEELRALFRFLARNTVMPTAASCLKVLNKSAAAKLIDAMSAGLAGRFGNQGGFRQLTAKQALKRIEAALSTPPPPRKTKAAPKPKPSTAKGKPKSPPSKNK